MVAYSSDIGANIMIGHSLDTVANYFKLYTKVHNTAYNFLTLLNNQGKLNDLEKAAKALRASIKQYKEETPEGLRKKVNRYQFCGRRLSELEELAEHYQAEIIARQVF